MSNTETKWFVEPHGAYANHTNEVLAMQLGDEYGWRTAKALVNVKDAPAYITTVNLWPVPRYAFVTALSGMRGVSFRVFKQEGGGQIREHDKKLFERRARARRVKKKVHKGN